LLCTCLQELQTDAWFEGVRVQPQHSAPPCTSCRQSRQDIQLGWLVCQFALLISKLYCLSSKIVDNKQLPFYNYVCCVQRALLRATESLSSYQKPDMVRTQRGCGRTTNLGTSNKYNNTSSQHCRLPLKVSARSSFSLLRTLLSHTGGYCASRCCKLLRQRRNKRYEVRRDHLCGII
jgi:hypothetical protein